MSRLDASSDEARRDRWRLSGLLGVRAVLVLLAGLAASCVAALADAAGEHDGLSRLDPEVAADVLRIRTPALTQLAEVFTFLGSEVVVGGLALAVLVLLLARRQLVRAGVFAIGIAGAAFLTVAVKLLVARPRPGAVDRLGGLDASYSFPSGHTLSSTVFLALAVWLLWPSVRYVGHVTLVAAAGLLALGVAASRLYLGYHWLTDVMASVLVATAWLCLVWLLGSIISRKVQAQAEGASGSETRATRPPGSASSRTTVPPAWWTSSRTIASPRPLPPASRSRASSRRMNRSKTRSRSASGTPVPSSMTSTSTAWSRSCASTRTTVVACRTALSARLSNTRRSASA
jgi:undecaprenyl-diphosphatase